MWRDSRQCEVWCGRVVEEWGCGGGVRSSVEIDGRGGGTCSVCIVVVTCFPSTANTAASLSMCRFTQDIWKPAGDTLLCALAPFRQER